MFQTQGALKTNSTNRQSDIFIANFKEDLLELQILTLLYLYILHCLDQFATQRSLLLLTFFFCKTRFFLMVLLTINRHSVIRRRDECLLIRIHQNIDLLSQLMIGILISLHHHKNHFQKSRILIRKLQHIFNSRIINTHHV